MHQPRDELVSSSSLDTRAKLLQSKSTADQKEMEKLLPSRADGTMLGGWEGWDASVEAWY